MEKVKTEANLWGKTKCTVLKSKIIKSFKKHICILLEIECILQSCDVLVLINSRFNVILMLFLEKNENKVNSETAEGSNSLESRFALSDKSSTLNYLSPVKKERLFEKYTWPPLFLISFKIEKLRHICSKMDGSRVYQTKRSKSEREIQIPYNVIYTWNLKYDINEPIYKTETDS